MTRRSVLLRVSPWSATEVHGGALRSQQVADLVLRALPGCTIQVCRPPRSHSRREMAAIAMRGAGEAVRGMTPVEALFTAFVDRTITGLGLAAGDLVIYDADQRYATAMVRVAARRRLRLVALPHNVEALIPYTWPIVIDVARTGRDLAREVGWLARADQVWAIGSLDRDLFQLFGIDARLLPYAPPAARAAELAAIRTRRASLTPQHILILGTAHNAPTRAGMLEQLAMARSTALPLPVILAGYGTEALAAEAPAGVTVVGSQPWPALTELIANAAALWVHQAPMSGALTRIPEALIAGLPVLANRWAARGHVEMAGMQVYAEAEDFAACLAALPTSFPPPDFTAAEARFCAALTTLAA